MDFVVGSTLFREGDVKVSAEIVDGERSVSHGKRRVGESSGSRDGFPRRVVNLDLAAGEIRDVQSGSAIQRAESETLVNGGCRVIDHGDGLRGVDGRAPTGDHSIFGIKDEA